MSKRTDIQFVCEKIREILNQKIEKCVIASDRMYLTTLQQAVASIRWQRKHHQLLADIIIDHCIRAEKTSPCSFFPTLNAIIGCCLGFTLNLDPAEFVKKSYVPTWEQLSCFVRSTVADPKIVSLLFEAVDLAGLEGRVFFEKSVNETTSIELTNGFHFSIQFPVVSVGKKRNSKVIIADGFVEEVSEIHHLLQKFSETREHLLLVLRGVSPDVIQTIQTNNSRGTLNVSVGIVKYDFDGINTLADMAIAAGTDVISSAKGQLFSGVKYEEIAVVKSLECQKTTVIIENDKTLASARLQVQKLLEKRNNAEFEDIGKLFDARIRSLTPRSVYVRIPPSLRHLEYSEMFDVGLRTIKSAIKLGMFKSEEKSIFPSEFLLQSALATCKYSKTCVQLLQNTGEIIT